MNYSVSLLTTKADCQALINIASAEKEALAYDRQGLLRLRDSHSITAAEIETELITVNTELGILQQVLDTLPDGKLKDETFRKFKKSEYKKFLLEQRSRNYGVLALLQKEYDIACIDQKIAESDAFILAVTERMNQIP